MTTPFRVPEPSLEAVRVAMERTILGRMGDEATCRRIVRELYLEDLPRIVRSEVERFREWRQSVALYGVTQEDDEREYLAARFPEPPETRNLGNLFDGLVGSISAPSAETATPEPKECPCTGRACPYDCDPLCNETPGDPCQGAKCFHATGIREGDPVPSEPHWQSLARALYPMGPMTESERAFVRRLAKNVVVHDSTATLPEIVRDNAALKAAARRLLSEEP